MSWKEWNIVEERLRFIARLLDGEKMAGLCRTPNRQDCQFGVRSNPNEVRARAMDGPQPIEPPTREYSGQKTDK